MDLMTKLRYQGYLATPPLWYGKMVSKFKQIEFETNSVTFNDSLEFKSKRLGKLVEEFVFYQLKRQPSITWICDNIQIQNGKRTIGEIDALYYYEENPIHLEIVYKFYLYDRLKNYSESLAYWIGPNRKDSLLYKLNKLHNKQFPLLYNEITSLNFEVRNLDIKIIKQHLCFKAQLFLPYHNRNIDVSPLNRHCLAGYFIGFKEIDFFKKFNFYIPVKLDWLVIPHHNVDWINYSSALKIIESEINHLRSPLVWLNKNDGELNKCFITFW